ncbi:hypothetical protein SLS59_009934 [Nothophoma quercina]|uniref:Uncharacterized protein n=1 Tax=Nothophoma quercina TaxID=749835 RepID=A0ABR3QJE1_9PLEO
MADSIQNLSNLSDEDLQRLASTPVAEPPAGITSNSDNPPSRASLQVWTTSVFLVIAMMFHMNRLYVKTMLMKSWSWDDDPESDLDGKKAPSSIEELCEERQEDKAMELNALEPLHVTVPVGRYRNA